MSVHAASGPGDGRPGWPLAAQPRGLVPLRDLGGLALAPCLRTDRAARLALGLAAALVLVPGGVKSVRLLGERPDDRLLELHSRTNQERWHSELPWKTRECLRVLPRALRPAPEL